jgi:type III secretory pathway component EscU
MSDERTDEKLDLDAILENAKAGGHTDATTVVRLVQTIKAMRLLLGTTEAVLEEADEALDVDAESPDEPLTS